MIAYNDTLAIGVVKGMRGAGVRVPDDVSVIGFDNIAMSEIVDPALTTVAAPLRAMGIIGVNNLIASIEKDLSDQMVHFMLNTHRIQAVCLDVDGLAVPVKRLHAHHSRSRDLPPEPIHAQAAFPVFDLLRAVIHDRRIDERGRGEAALAFAAHYHELDGP